MSTPVTAIRSFSCTAIRPGHISGATSFLSPRMLGDAWLPILSAWGSQARCRRVPIASAAALEVSARVLRPVQVEHDAHDETPASVAILGDDRSWFAGNSHDLVRGASDSVAAPFVAG